MCGSPERHCLYPHRPHVRTRVSEFSWAIVMGCTRNFMGQVTCSELGLMQQMAEEKLMGCLARRSCGRKVSAAALTELSAKVLDFGKSIENVADFSVCPLS